MGFVISLLIIVLKFFSILNITWTVTILFVIVFLLFEAFGHDMSKASSIEFASTLRENIFSNEKAIENIEYKIDNLMDKIEYFEEELERQKSEEKSIFKIEDFIYEVEYLRKEINTLKKEGGHTPPNTPISTYFISL